jgi:hypothetical protein
MYRSEDDDRSYRESTRRNRAERTKEIKGFLGLGEPSSSGPSLKEMLFGTAVAFAIPVAIAFFMMRADGQKDASPPPAAAPRESRPSAPAPKVAIRATAADSESKTKYHDAVAEEKQRRERENDSLLREYGKKCGNPRGKSLRLRCSQLDARLDNNNKWLLRH